MDRAYRYGQTRDVSVYRLLGAGSLEELIYARQVYKQQQMAVGYDASLQTRYFDGVQGDKQRQGELFGLKNIFGLKEGEIGTKMAVSGVFFFLEVNVMTRCRLRRLLWLTSTGRWRIWRQRRRVPAWQEILSGSTKRKQKGKRKMYGLLVYVCCLV